METVILVGIPGSGKTTFYRERFFETHVRISLDMLRMRDREGLCQVVARPEVSSEAHRAADSVWHTAFAIARH